MGDIKFLILMTAVLLSFAVIDTGCVQNPGGSPRSPSGSGVQRLMTNLTAAAEKLNLSDLGQMNLTGAAQQLGVSEQDLENTLNGSLQGQLNLTDAAQHLGVTTRELADALGIELNATMNRGG